MFDEMSIRENLHFSQKFGCIEGFEDLGSHGRKRFVANHALVFMLHGLHKKWKQPVAYYLVRGSTKGQMLGEFLMEVLGACHDAGLEVVATVCDMAANNVMALKKLGVSEETPFFKFRDQGIAAVFDPPNLLKCTRNLFLKYNVANVECDITLNGEQVIGTAKWHDILKLYEVDKCNVYRLLPKVTDSHIKPVGQNTMKVSLAAQVMRSSVAAAISTLVTVGKDQCTVSLNDIYRLISSDVMWCHCSCTLISLTELSYHECNSRFSILFAGYMDGRCMATAAFVKEIDSLFNSFTGVACNPNCAKVLRC
jgi:hypothetical protein